MLITTTQMQLLMMEVVFMQVVKKLVQYQVDKSKMQKIDELLMHGLEMVTVMVMMKLMV